MKGCGKSVCSRGMRKQPSKPRRIYPKRTISKLGPENYNAVSISDGYMGVHR